ncbi:MAG TPA: DUF2784 domain-containing protein [Pirellulaceae bacterium]|nr:DUF2784 domain-containing protein [Pirellulaceae bacterium]
MNLYSVLADVVVFVHAAYVSFVVLGLVAILIGWVLRWRWVRNLWFRVVHLVMIGVVVVESLLDITCPLTTLENNLRRTAGETARGESFVGRCVHDLLFYDAPAWSFTVAYCMFGAIVLATFVIAPPNWRLAQSDKQVV